MKNRVLIFLVLFLVGGVYSFATVPGKPPGPQVPINTNQIVLIIAGVLIMAGVIAYKKLSIKKA